MYDVRIHIIQHLNELDVCNVTTRTLSSFLYADII